MEKWRYDEKGSGFIFDLLRLIFAELFKFIEMMLKVFNHSLAEFLFISVFQNFNQIEVRYFANNRNFFKWNQVTEDG